jgi:formylglycine-generating enzyme required for sulfatase activity
MCYGVTANGTTHVKLFGIEDFWGNIWEWIDGLWTDAQRNIITSWTTFADGNSGEPVESSQTVTAASLTDNSSGYNKKVSGNSQTGFMPVEWDGSTSTYWADRGDLFASCVLRFGG